MREGRLRVSRSVKTRRLQDGVGDLIGRQVIDGDRGVCGAVERQTALVAGGKIGLIGEDGADLLTAAAAGEGGGQLDLEMDEDGSGRGEEQVAGFIALDGSAAQGQHEGIGGGEAGDGRVLAIAKSGLAELGEDLRDGHGGFGLDHVIHVKEAPAKPVCNQRADSAFA